MTCNVFGGTLNLAQLQHVKLFVSTYEKTANVMIVVSRQPSDIDLRTSPAMYISTLYGNPCRHNTKLLPSAEWLILG